MNCNYKLLIVIIFFVSVPFVFRCTQKKNYYLKVSTVKKPEKEASFNEIDTVGQHIVEISKVPNFFQGTYDFSVSSKSHYNVLAFGEGIFYKFSDGLIKSYTNDGVEIYFDLKNDKVPAFDANGDDRIFKLVWGSGELLGININKTNVEFFQVESSDSSYNVEIKIPWKSLGYISPGVGKTLGFDIVVQDNDKNFREGIIGWTLEDDFGYSNTSLYGNLLLSNRANSNADKGTAIANLVDNKLIIDGFAEKAWNISTFYNIKNIIQNPISNASDLSGRFKALWDIDNLYLFIEIKDDIKTQNNIFYDYGWIADSKGNIIWKMDINNSRWSGGSIKNRVIKDTIQLYPGKYKLNYVSDESHSWNAWDDKAPNTDFYGIRLTKSR